MIRTLKLVAVLGMLHSALVLAAEPAPSSAARPAPSLAESQGADRLHGLERRPLTPAERPPTIPVRPDGQPDRPSIAAASASARAAAAAVCSTSEFESLSGSALVSKIKTCDVASLNSLYSLAGTAGYRVFQESKMASVAYGLRDVAVSYPGSNSTQALQLVTFLRAGYYVQYAYPDDIGQYGAALKTAMRAALDTFFGNANAYVVNDDNGNVLFETVTLVDSAYENARYLNRMIDILNRFDNAWLASYYMRNAANGVFTVVFKGHYRDDFNVLIQSDQRIIDALYNFYNRWTSLLGTSNVYLLDNAASEMARFLEYTGTVQNKVRPLVRDLLSRTSINGSSAPIYVGVAELANYFDMANCSYYGTCNLQQQIETTVLPISYNCSATLRIRAQEMTNAQLASTCATQATEETRFHTMLETGRVPVSGDLNSDLEMVVFNSSTDYQTYSGVLFGNSTDNGGIYLEGDPSNANTQARFIAYEAEWLRPTFTIWNLEHEYVHYLDGRFDMRGSFSDYLTGRTVWWLEGLAEYVAFVGNNPTAVDAVRNVQHVPLSTIWNTTYDSGALRVYRFGYFAVRFMFERHRADVRSILTQFRAGNYTAYDSYLLSTIGSRYDSEFQSWLRTVIDGGGGNSSPAAGFSFTINNLTASFTDSSTDSDGTIASRRWDFGDGTTSTQANPVKTYASAGTRTVTLTVTDNLGATGTISKSVAVGGVTPGECTASSLSELGLNCSRSNRTKPAGGLDYMYLQVPAGVSQLKITVSGGTGNANLYYNSTTWATTSNYQYSSTNAGNNETLTINSPAAGTVYVTLHAAAAFSGVKVTVQTVTGGGGLPECTGSELHVLGKNCARSNRTKPAGSYDYMTISLPAGVSQLKITVSGGTGNANLYYSSSTWATTSNYQQSSTNAGNNETLTIANPPSGYVYISLHAATAFSGVKVTTEY